MPRILGVDPALYGVSGEVHVVLGEAKLLPGSNLYLRLYQVDSGDKLSYRVLYLDTGVHFHEVEVSVLVHQELYCSGVLIAADLCGSHRGSTHLLAELRSHDGAGAFLKDLLIVPLEGALALAQVHDIAVIVGEKLYLHMPRIHDELLDVHIAVAEARKCLLLSRDILRLQVLLAFGKADSASAAAGGSLYHNGIAYLGGYLMRFLDRRYRRSREPPELLRRSSSASRKPCRPSRPLPPGRGR